MGTRVEIPGYRITRLGHIVKIATVVKTVYVK